MTEQDKLTYLKLAFRCVELGFTDMEVELISKTYESIKKKKGNFNLRDAAIIRAEVLRKHRPVVEDDFKELEEMEEEREIKSKSTNFYTIEISIDDLHQCSAEKIKSKGYVPDTLLLKNVYFDMDEFLPFLAYYEVPKNIFLNSEYMCSSQIVSVVLKMPINKLLESKGFSREDE